ncbi:glycerophosphoryl diester phosphodiesterase [Halogeometricum borinquense DSM 11551]|uniref:Glycerophosphoryl diester phosphodiesterase n=2 Tax=Halogeometricum borinquense (strain ATCC 700274 / DSM 11551 / JCM 10706 / KCTC 4070 / PR3) TaxID=469382 RepID=L9UFP0_HALBP|nr:glycerophosphodiester phosphodiesterase [Halogeometricum borinquense]ELY23689.1 glycerophosphoryl diester phosphodiesterase [Halogeometricum borinquense DSM 11551]
MSWKEYKLDRRSFVAGALTGTSTVAGVSSLTSVVPPETNTASSRESERMNDDGTTDPAIIAHRGFAGVYPENTVGAVGRATWGDDAEMVEIDIVPTADGKVVVFHDSELSGRDGGERGPTDLDGYVWDHSWEELQETEVLQSGETIPRLEQVFDAIPDDAGVNIEFKNPGTTNVRFAEKLSAAELESQMEVWRPMAETALEIAADAENDVLVSSFHEAALAVVRDIDPDVPIGCLFWDSIETGLAITREYDCEAIHPPYNMIQGTPFFEDEYYLSGPFADVDLVEVAHEEGRTVNTWTIGTWYQAERLAEAGVDGLIADYPNLLWSAENTVDNDNDSDDTNDSDNDK